MTSEDLHLDQEQHHSFIAMFRVAPRDACLLFEQPRNWCTAIASQAGRKIRTERAYSIVTQKGGASKASTRVTFLDGPQPSPAKQAQRPIQDPRQIDWCVGAAQA